MAIFRNIYVCTYMQVITIKKRRHESERREQEGIWKDLERGRKRNGEMMSFILESQKQEIIKKMSKESDSF